MKKRPLLVAPSMGCCDPFDLARQVDFLDRHADLLHIDIKDGNYVRSFGVGPDFMAALRTRVSTPMDAHLMVLRPQDFLEDCAAAGAGSITVHADRIESDAFVTLNRIGALGCKAGVALNPATPPEAVRYYLPLLAKVTVMTVDPGYSGQAVVEAVYGKVSTLAQWRSEEGLDFLIEADGSMNAGAYGPLYRAGADVVVLGPPALWDKAARIEDAWEVMEGDMAQALASP